MRATPARSRARSWGRERVERAMFEQLVLLLVLPGHGPNPAAIGEAQLALLGRHASDAFEQLQCDAVRSARGRVSSPPQLHRRPLGEIPEHRRTTAQQAGLRRRQRRVGQLLHVSGRAAYRPQSVEHPTNSGSPSDGRGACSSIVLMTGPSIRPFVDVLVTSVVAPR